MIPGDSLTAKAAHDPASSEEEILSEGIAADAKPDREAITHDFLARTMEEAVADDVAAASDEAVSDSVWREAELDETRERVGLDDDPADDLAADPLNGLDVDASAVLSDAEEPVDETAGDADQSPFVAVSHETASHDEPAPHPGEFEAEEALDGSGGVEEVSEPAPLAAEDEPVDSIDHHNDTVTGRSEDHRPDTRVGTDTGALGLQAVSALGERISTTERRTEDALDKIGYAIGMIAERIDGLEARLTDQAINSAALANDTAPVHKEPDNSKVAPYLAQAERELATKKESGPMDIFDRIARAAETEFDSSKMESGRKKLAARATDGRRVGTKKWTPSRTVKRRIAEMEASGTDTSGAATGTEASTAAQARSASASVVQSAVAGVGERAAAAAQSAPRPAQPAPDTVKRDPVGAREEPHLEFIDDDFEDDDAGLSIVPGARGRRKDRARKSRLDEDFESVFVEGEDKASIGALRRKLRQADAERAEQEEHEFDDDVDNEKVGGFLGKLFKRGKSKPAASVNVDDEEAAMMAAFDDEPTVTTSKKRKAAVQQPQSLDDEFEENEARVSFIGGPLLYVLIAALAIALLAGWFMFMN